MERHDGGLVRTLVTQDLDREHCDPPWRHGLNASLCLQSTRWWKTDTFNVKTNGWDCPYSESPQPPLSNASSTEHSSGMCLISRSEAVSYYFLEHDNVEVNENNIIVMWKVLDRRRTRDDQLPIRVRCKHAYHNSLSRTTRFRGPGMLL